MFGRLMILTIALGLAAGFFWPQSGPAPHPAQSADVVMRPQTATKAEPEHRIDTVIQRHEDGHFYVNAEVNGQLVRFVVDTGASTIALTEADAKRVGIAFSPTEYEVIARGASGDVRGKRVNINHIAIDQKEAFDQRAMVVAQGLDVSLLGQSFLSQIGTVVIDGERMVLR